MITFIVSRKVKNMVLFDLIGGKYEKYKKKMLEIVKELKSESINEANMNLKQNEHNAIFFFTFQ